MKPAFSRFPFHFHLAALFLPLLLAAALARAGLDDAPTDTASMGLGGEFTLLPTDLGRPAQGLRGDRTLNGLASLIVLHEGRVKPVETMARHLMLQWSGRESVKDTGGARYTALEALATILFAPEKTGDFKLFRIDNPEVAEAMGVEPQKKRLYTYRQLEPGLERLQRAAANADTVPKEQRSAVDQELLRTFSNVADFLNLTRAAQFALPSASLFVALPETRAALELGPGPTHSFWEMMARAPRIAHILDGVSGDKMPSPVEAEIVRLSRAMFLQSQTGSTSHLRVVPEPGREGSWLSPPEVIADAARLQRLNAEISSLAAMAEAYRAGDAAAFGKHADAFNAAVKRLTPAETGNARIGLEVLKNRADLLFRSTVLFWLAMFGGFLYFLFRRRWIYATTWIVSLLAIILLTLDIVARMLIMHRPPVTSLFETFPFVAAISIAVALFLEHRSRQGVALLAAGMLGTGLLTIASRYALDGDTKQVLVAVLNSNFWLSTHVVTITVGYAACVLAGAIAHVRLARAAWTPSPTPEGRAALRDIDRMVYGTICFGLLFSFIGTVLGGIWADQSWGRFWGWDPKENGALLIVIWCAILLHAKHFGVIRETGMAAGAVLGAIIVSLAWQGVNLLNVGLHSYGFTSGAALKLFGYIGAELLFLLAMWGLTAVRKRKMRAAG